MVTISQHILQHTEDEVARQRQLVETLLKALNEISRTRSLKAAQKIAAVAIAIAMVEDS